MPPQSTQASTRSPALKRVTPLPVSSTTPVISVPGVKGKGGLRWYLPAITSEEAKETPAALTSMRNWSGLSAGSSTSSIFRSSGVPHFRHTMARMSVRFLLRCVALT